MSLMGYIILKVYYSKIYLISFKLSTIVFLLQHVLYIFNLVLRLNLTFFSTVYFDIGNVNYGNR